MPKMGLLQHDERFLLAFIFSYTAIYAGKGWELNDI